MLGLFSSGVRKNGILKVVLEDITNVTQTTNDKETPIATYIKQLVPELTATRTFVQTESYSPNVAVGESQFHHQFQLLLSSV